MTKLVSNNESAKIAEAATDAFYYGRYGLHEWKKAARFMALQGYDSQQIEAVLRSNWPGLAANAADRGDFGATAGDLTRWISESHANGKGGVAARVEALAQEFASTRRFPESFRGLIQVASVQTLTGADLAGYCEGEDIAELIDLARYLIGQGGNRDAASIYRAKALLIRLELKARQ